MYLKEQGFSLVMMYCDLLCMKFNPQPHAGISHGDLMYVSQESQLC